MNTPKYHLKSAWEHAGQVFCEGPFQFCGRTRKAFIVSAIFTLCYDVSVSSPIYKGEESLF